MERRELFYLMLPCLFFAGIALLLSGHGKQVAPPAPPVFVAALPRKAAPPPSPAPTIPPKGPFGWRVMSKERRSMTPREVGLGYWEKWVVELESFGVPKPLPKPQQSGWSYDGTEPDAQNLRLTTLQANKETLLALPKRQTISFDWAPEGSAYGTGPWKYATLTFLVPPLSTSGPVFLKTEIRPLHEYIHTFSTATSTGSTNKYTESKAQNFTLQIHKQGESVSAPPVSHDCLVRIEKTIVRHVGKAKPYRDDVEILVEASQIGGSTTSNYNTGFRAKWDFELPRIVDDGGQEYNFGGGSGTSYSPNGNRGVWSFTTNFDGPDSDNQYIKNRKGRLWLLSKVSVNNCWPLDIRVLLRNTPQRK